MRIIRGISFITAILLSSCQAEPKISRSADLEKIAELKGQLGQLKIDDELKDALIQESLTFFDQIQANLEVIRLKNNEIKIKSENPDATEQDKQWIIQEIKHINFLREENGKKVNSLNNELKKSGLKIKELENMIERLIKEMESNDNEISVLQSQIETKTSEYSAIFDAYLTQAVILGELTDRINTGYYTYGKERELRDNQVIEKQKGFIGIGKKTKLLNNFNEAYFEKIDISMTKEILVEGTKIRFITDHPSSSYTLQIVGNNTKILISNPKEFWRVTKYLVVLVD
jgi:hypothetical protein